MIELGLGSFTSSALTKQIVAGATVGTKKGLALVDSEIDKVLEILQRELEEIEGNNFEVAAHIRKPSFGQGSEAVVLGTDHSAAHTVVVKGLTDLIDDLTLFRKSVKEASDHLYDADDDAKTRITTTLNRTTGLDYGVNRPVDRNQFEEPGTTSTSGGPAVGPNGTEEA